jgi:uncharacterized heparinase superfamily protein
VIVSPDGAGPLAISWLHVQLTFQSLPRYLVRLYCTLRHISFKQGMHLFRARLVRRAVPREPSILRQRAWRRPWSSPRWRPAAWGTDGTVTFLGHARQLPAAGIWNGQGESRLWYYNLHYLDDLDALPASARFDALCALLDDWVSNNPPGRGTGWEPYPLSLRIVNIVKFLVASGRSPRWDRSLALQTQSLCQQVETHIRANHLFENGKALVFAGTYFEGPSAETWLRTGLEILDTECEEQFLSDGGHFELSPMYHGTMLWSLCDLLNLAETSGLTDLLRRASTWQQLLRRGLGWYATMTHPDGGIAFFNDAALGIAPDLSSIMTYALNVGVPTEDWHPSTPPPSLVRLSSSGYLKIDLGHRCAAIIDVAKVGPAYQPAHAHADTLSFELCLHGRRVLVNSGTSTYERGPQRDTERGTAAHNTVIVDRRNSSDTWAGFRVGRRASPELLDLDANSDRIVIRAQHDGYRHLLGGAVHRRSWTWTVSDVQIRDDVIGRFQHAAAHYHIHPDVIVRPDRNDAQRLQLDLPDGKRASVRVQRGSLSFCASTWHPEFGRSVDNQCIVVDFAGGSAEVVISWTDQH